MRKTVVLPVLSVLLFLLISCSPSPGSGSNSEPQIINKSVSDIPKGSFVELDVSSADEITLSDFTEEDGILVYKVGGSKGFAQPKGGNSNIVINKNGLGMPVPHENGQTSFPVSAVNVGNSGKIRVEHFELSSDLEITHDEMASLTINGRDKTINSRGERVTEEFYRIDLKKGPYAGYDKDEVAIVQIIKGDTVNYSNPEYGFIKNGKIDLSTTGDEIHGLVDLSHKKAVTVFNTIEYAGGTNMLCKIALVIPQELTPDPDSPLEIKSNTNVYKVMKADNDTGNYVIEITTNSTDPKHYNSDYHVLLRDNARARYIEGDHIGRRRGPNLIPISRTGSTIRLWVGEIDESFIFDCIIDDERASYGSIELRTASPAEETWASTHILSTIYSDEKPFLQLELNPGDDVITYYATGLNGDYTLEVENVSENNGAHADMLLVYGNKNSRGAGSMGFNYNLDWSSSFNDGYMILSIWNPDNTLKLKITLSNTIHHNIRYNSSTSKFECEDEGCDKYFNAENAGDLLVGNWEMNLDSKYFVTFGVIEWNEIPMVIRNKNNGATFERNGTAEFDGTTNEITLHIPAPCNKDLKLESFCFGQSMTFTDGTVATMVE